MSNKISRDFIMDFEKGIVAQNSIIMFDEECRICLEDGNLIYPCNCSSGIHLKCLKKWIIAERNTHPNECEICKQNYKIAWNKLFYEQNIFINNTVLPPPRQQQQPPPPPPQQRSQPPPPPPQQQSQPPPPPPQQRSPPPPPPPPPPQQLPPNQLYQLQTRISNLNPRQVVPIINPDSWTENEYIRVSRIMENERNRISYNNRIILFQSGLVVLMIGDAISIFIYFTCDNNITCLDSGWSSLIFSCLIALLGFFYCLFFSSSRASVSNIR